MNGYFHKISSTFDEGRDLPIKMGTPYTTEKILVTILWAFLIIFADQGVASSGVSNGEKVDWQTIETENAVIYFQSMDDLRIFNSRIDFQFQKPNLINPAVVTQLSNTTAEVAEKTDAIFRRSRNILEMHGFMNKIKIKVFKNKNQLNDAFYSFYNTEGNARAWYTHEKLTICVQLNDLHAGMLAHEVAHAIIDHYLIIPPPNGTAEILARYVDTHLHDDQIKRTAHKHQKKSAQAKGYSKL